MSTTFYRLKFKGYTIYDEGGIQLAFYKPKKIGVYYFNITPNYEGRAGQLSMRTLSGVLSYSRKKYKKLKHTLEYGLDGCIGKSMLCEIHDEGVKQKDCYRLQNVEKKKK